MRKIFKFIAVVSLAALANIGYSADLKVGFIYIGPPGDHGWNYQHDVGRKSVDDAFGGKVETVFQENVPESADAERVMTQMALSGVDMIFATSFGYMDPVLNVAKKFPKVKFEHATGYKTADNVSTYSARFYEGRSVIGHIAGKMTKSNKIGYVASFPIPEVVRGINSAYLAAKKANSNVEFKVIWLFTWYDPAKEADAAKTLISQGADIIMQHVDSSAIMTVAEEAGVYAFGQASDMGAFGTNAQLTSIINGWGPYYVERVKQVMDGTWEGGKQTFDGIGAGMVVIGKMSDKIPSDVRKEAMALADGIASGKVHSFTGPINKQDGSAWLKAGETADIGTLLGMNFYVEGLEGDIPK
jgi:simple sugar transport system substrate-binding protein